MKFFVLTALFATIAFAAPADDTKAVSTSTNSESSALKYLLANSPAGHQAEEDSPAPPGCFWDGYAPFCAGSCPDGYVEADRGSCGDGAGSSALKYLLANSPAGHQAEEDGPAPPGCYWDGTAPFCAGSCPDGYEEANRGSCGDGACCWTGYKFLCCRIGD
ncbi:hypothetical protein CVT25_002068 [Psilocybe cyanescens]|uniref:Uncharacterized protein n=1 Tax=Psilocybe cyanescens TaxID=93625 RepID=A0A409X9B2_PSICY|nr:hypothetical protein CVT25_002068 [Psilocybe cyanescens]